MKYLINIYEFLNESKIEDIYSKYYSDIDSGIFNQIVLADPTSIIKNGELVKMGMYSKWLLNLYNNENLLIEDLYKATDYLKQYDSLKRTNIITGREANILICKSLPDLFEVVSRVGGTGKPTEDENYLIDDRYFINSGEADVFYEDEAYLIVIPKTYEASKFYAHQTEWCTKYPDMYRKYSSDGDLYVIINKKEINTRSLTRRLQFHFNSSQYMNILDKQVTQDVKSELYPIFTKNNVPNVEFMVFDRVIVASQGYVVKKDGKYGFVKSLDETPEYKYDTVGVFSEGRAYVTRNVSRLEKVGGYIDEHGNEIISLQYEDVSSFKDGTALVLDKRKCGIIDLDGEIVVPFEYDKLYNFNGKEYTIFINNDNTGGFITKDGKKVSIPNVNDISKVSQCRAVVQYQGKIRYVDMEGNDITEPKYVSGEEFHGGRALVSIRQGNNFVYRHGFIDLDGNEVIPLEYTKAKDFRHGTALVQKGNMWYELDLDGNVLDSARDIKQLHWSWS